MWKGVVPEGTASGSKAEGSQEQSSGGRPGPLRMDGTWGFWEPQGQAEWGGGVWKSQGWEGGGLNLQQQLNDVHVYQTQD